VIGAPNVARTPDADASATTRDSPVRVLLVDDNAAKRLAFRAALTPLGYSIVEADSGLAALRCIMEHDFAVILLDVCMPSMNGFETAALIRQRRQTEMTPIIFITAFGKDEIAHHDYFVQGAVDFMSGPIVPEELRAKVSVFAHLFQKVDGLTSQTRELQASTDQLRRLANAAPIGIYQADRQNRYMYVNARWSVITGISGDLAFGNTWDEIIESERHDNPATEVIGLDEDPSASGQRFEMRRPGMPTQIILATSERIPDGEGGWEGWVGIVADITAESGAKAALAQARDAATEASRLKSDFLANMSHEIRTPMNGVIGLTELLLETDLDPRQLDYAQAVRRSGEALLEIINDILDFSKVESGTLEVANNKFALGVIVNDVVDLLAGSAQRKNLDLVVVCADSVPAVVTGDAGRLRQVLMNLIGNAVKFTHDGEIALRVTATKTGPDAVVRFEVSDTGDGIPASKLEAIFEPFVQADTSTSRKYQGTGLGLAISAQLVTLMGGQYGVESVLGAGSTFWFSIPLGADAYQATQTVPPAHADLDGVSILVVDDSATQLEALMRDLTDFGMTVKTIDSGAAALAALRRAATDGRPYAVALIDRSMPGMDGLELANHIVGDPTLSTRLILMTGLHKDRDLRRTTVPGVAASLSKPVHRRELLACVRTALGLAVADMDLTIGVAPFPALREVQPSGRVLLAEDNEINQKVAVAMLSGAGYRVDTVPDGAAAVQAVATQRYDAILMDCQLPGMSGYEATTAIRAQAGSGRHTPIIAMTAGARPEDREQCLAVGMDSYLSKPVRREALLDLVASSIKSSQSSLSEGLRGGPDPSINQVTLDPDVFDKLRLLGSTSGNDFLSGIVRQFVSSTDQNLGELRSALDHGDGRTVGRIAHTIKEGSGRLGGRRLARSCDHLERKTLTASLMDGGADMSEVEIDYRDLRFALLQELSKSDQSKRAAS
jgi:two-component system sensor histidine kinase/response regulator